MHGTPGAGLTLICKMGKASDVLTTVEAGRLTIRGVSLGGVYTSLHVPELDLFFDLFFVLILFRPTLKPPTHANTPHRSSTPSTP